MGPFPCLSPREYDLGSAPLNENEKDAKKDNCTDVDEAYIKLEGFETNELAVQKLSGAYEKLASLPNFNASTEDPQKASNAYYFWIRPTSEWTCSNSEFKKTFDALDEAAV